MRPHGFVLAVFVAILMTVSRSVAIEAAENAHLLPVAATFDVGPPIGETYSRVCEQMLFGQPNWRLRYYSASESVTTGMAITSDGRRYGVSVKQARPELYSVVANAFYRKLNLESSLATVKITEAKAEIPQSVALAINRLWLSLLRGTGTDEAPKPYILSAKIILYGKTTDGTVLSGMMPPAFLKDKRLGSVEDIVDELMKLCVEPEKKRKRSFVRIEQKATAFSPQ